MEKAFGMKSTTIDFLIKYLYLYFFFHIFLFFIKKTKHKYEKINSLFFINSSYRFFTKL